MAWNLFATEETPAPDQPEHRMAHDADVAKTVEEALECDYERDCTPLYKQIENEEWGSVAKFLDTGYWPGNFFADSILSADQARTWVTRFDPNDNKKVRWSQLPLHLAIVIEAPYEIVGRLIELYPQAVRCTDDQHMLPLHLAMRHGSSDRIVDLLLAAFPDAVNAKGKNDRTPIDCAIRGPNKVRGRILGAFVEKSKAKATKSAVAAYTKEIALLKAKLEDKTQELDEIRSKVTGLESAKDSVQLALEAKIQELEDARENVEVEANKKFEEYQAERLVEEFEIQKKIEELEKEKLDLEQAHDQAKEEEAGLRKELETVQTQVVESTSPDDLDKLKQEVESLKTFRLEANRNQANDEMEKVRKQLADEILKTDGNAKDGLRAMQITIDELRQQSTVATSSDEISTLRDELVALRKELREKEEASKTKIDLVLLKKILEKEMVESESNTKIEIEAVKKAVESMNLTQLESKTNDELTTLKKEMQALRNEMKERELADHTKQELEALKSQLNQQLTASEGKTKQELKIMKRAVEGINVEKLESQTKEEMILVKKELNILKEQLKETEKSSKMKLELAILKKSLESELRNTQGKNKIEINAIKSAIKTIDKKEVDKKSFDELSAIKLDVSKLKDEMLLKEESKELKQELAELKLKLAEQLAASEGKAKEEMVSVKAAVEAINIRELEIKNREEFDTMKTELDTVKKQMYDREAANKLKVELTVMKKSLESELIRSQDKNRDDVTALKKSVEMLNEHNLKSQNTEQLAALKTEIEGLKKEMKEKDQAVKDLENMKTVIAEQLKESEGKTKEELTSMKKAVESIDIKSFETQNKEEWTSMKTEISQLKKNINETQSHVKTKKDLEVLKQALEAEMKSSEGKTKEELTAMKMAVEAIDVSKLEKANHSEWGALKTEVDALKKELKIKECEGLMVALDEDLKKSRVTKAEVTRTRRAMNEIDMNFADLSFYDIVEKKREIEAIRGDITQEAPQKRSIAVVSPAPSVVESTTESEAGRSTGGGAPKKRGLRKMFGRLLSRKKIPDGKGASAAADAATSREIINEIESQPEPEPLMSPPSMLNTDQRDDADDSDEDEEIVEIKEEVIYVEEEVDEEEKKEDETPSYLPTQHAPVKVVDDSSVVSSSSKRSMRSTRSARSAASQRSQRSQKSQNSASSRKSTASSTKQMEVIKTDPALAPMSAEVDLDTMLQSPDATTVVTETDDGGTLEVETVVSSHHSVISSHHSVISSHHSESVNGELGEEVETLFVSKEEPLDNTDSFTAVSF